MDLSRELTALAAEPSDEEKPVVSLTLDTRWRDEAQRRRVAVYVRDECRTARDRYQPRSRAAAAVEEATRRIERWAAEMVGAAGDVAGVALFASPPRGLWREIRTSVALPPSFAVTPAPLLSPLAQLADRSEPVLLVLCDRRGGTVWESRLGEPLLSLALSRPAARRMKMAGWRQRSAQRRWNEQREQGQADLSLLVGSLFDRAGRPAVILAGPPDQVGALRGKLPRRVQEQLLPDLHLPAGTAQSRVLAAATRAIARAARGREQEEVARIVGEALGAGGRAVIGPADVVLATMEGRVKRLLVERGAAIAGWHCKACDAVGTKAAAGCPYCGGPTETRDLSEELVRRVIRAGGEAAVIDGGARLAHFDGVAALLRPGSGSAPVGWVQQEA